MPQLGKEKSLTPMIEDLEDGQLEPDEVDAYA